VEKLYYPYGNIHEEKIEEKRCESVLTHRVYRTLGEK